MSKMWPSHFISMFAHTAIIDLSPCLGTGAKTGREAPGEASVCRINSAGGLGAPGSVRGASEPTPDARA